jgi:cytidylate kinase
VRSIIIFSGLPQTGKTTLSRRLALELGCKFVSFGDFVRREAERKGIVNPTRQDLQDLGQQLVKANPERFCLEVLESVSFSPGEQLVMDGLRHKNVLDALSQITRNQPIMLIYLTASTEIRRRRCPRGVDLASVDAHEVESRSETEIKPLADLVIDTQDNQINAVQSISAWVRSDCAFNHKSKEHVS